MLEQYISHPLQHQCHILLLVIHLQPHPHNLPKHPYRLVLLLQILLNHRHGVVVQERAHGVEVVLVGEARGGLGDGAD